MAAVALLLSASLAVPAVFLARGSGFKTAVFRYMPGYATGQHPEVADCRPGAEEAVVSCDTHIAVDVRLPNEGAVVDAETVNSGSVRLIRKADRSIVPARVNTTAAGDAIVLTPEQPLEPNSYYRFEVLPALKDTSGASFTMFAMGFTTGGVQSSKMPVAFQKTELPETKGHTYTAVTVGPDGMLYAATYDGSIFRYTLNEAGGVVGEQLIDAVRVANGRPRLITGITFDPTAPAADPVLYVSHGQCTRTAAEEWTGKVSRLSGATLSEYEDLLVGLPRAARDHLNNQMAFGPDGALYMTQGSLSAMGEPDASWGNRPERGLSAAVLRIDLSKLHGTLDVRTTDGGGSYDPHAANAPVTLYATGLRSAYDLVWTRNGRLYAPINGSAAGGNTPGSPDGKVPALHDVRLTIPDQLALIRPGGYYGHPNPVRGQYVLMGGNPTSGRDPVEINRYAVGIQPDKNWVPPVAEFGQNLSPNGIIQFKGTGPAASLDGALFVCRYSGGKDVCVVIPNDDGTIKETITGISGLTRFADPLDLTQHPATGNLYVAEFGGKCITLVKPVAGGVSEKVYRQTVASRGVMEVNHESAQIEGADGHID